MPLPNVNSGPRVSQEKVVRSNKDMKTIEEIRRHNIKLLIAKSGSNVALAEKINKSAAQVSQWSNASRDSLSGRPRSISSDACREIESVLGLEVGWLDNNQGCAHGFSDDAIALANDFMSLDPAEQTRIRQYVAFAAAMEKHQKEADAILATLEPKKEQA